VERYRTVGTIFSVTALAARRPAPVVGPSAAAELIAVIVAAATAPTGLTAVAPHGVSGATVEQILDQIETISSQQEKIGNDTKTFWFRFQNNIGTFVLSFLA
jgi:hypothetical protein